MIKPSFKAHAAAALLALGAVTSASALSLTAGNYKITLDNFDSGTTYTSAVGNVCNTVATCNAAAAPPAPGSLGSVNTSADTMGIFSVAAISNLTTGQTEYIRGTTSTLGGVTFGPFLTGVFGNLSDFFVENTFSSITNITTTTALAQGGTFSLFSNAADYNPTSGPGVVVGTKDLNALMYPGISGGSLFLQGNFAAGAAVVGSTASYLTQYNNASLAGNGQGFLDFTGGSALSFFDTNSLTNVNGGTSDAFFTVTFDDAGGEASSLGWTVKSVAQISGQIPEPGSLALVSLALLGLGFSARRKAK